MTSKGPGKAPTYNEEAKSLRVGIIHARWNAPIIDRLVTGTVDALITSGVPSKNIILQTVPGSFELPIAVQRMHAASNASSSSSLVPAAADLLGTGTSDLISSATGGSSDSKSKADNNTTKDGLVSIQADGPLDAIIAIGVLIKGQTMHFEYISDAVSHGLQRVQLEAGIPVVFGVLTCLSEEQAWTRAGMKGGPNADPSKAKTDENVHYAEQGHNHGEDWGKAAVEMAVKRKGWGEGRYVDSMTAEHFKKNHA